MKIIGKLLSGITQFAKFQPRKSLNDKSRQFSCGTRKLEKLFDFMEGWQVWADYFEWTTTMMANGSENDNRNFTKFFANPEDVEGKRKSFKFFINHKLISHGKNRRRLSCCSLLLCGGDVWWNVISHHHSYFTSFTFFYHLHRLSDDLEIHQVEKHLKVRQHFHFLLKISQFLLHPFTFPLSFSRKKKWRISSSSVKWRGWLTIDEISGYFLRFHTKFSEPPPQHCRLMPPYNMWIDQRVWMRKKKLKENIFQDSEIFLKDLRLFGSFSFAENPRSSTLIFPSFHNGAHPRSSRLSKDFQRRLWGVFQWKFRVGVNSTDELSIALVLNIFPL